MSIGSATDSMAARARGARKYERLDTVVEVTVTSGNTFWTGLTQNVSQGGLFVVTDEPFPLGTLLSFRLKLGGHRETDVRGTVRWIRSADDATDDLPGGMGVQFTTLDQTTEEAIHAFIERQRESLYFDTDDEDL